MQICTDGLVLKAKNIAEADLVLTILTRECGVVTAFANGAKKLKSKLMSSAQMLTYSDFKLYKSRDHYTVDSAETISVFFGVRSDIDKLSVAGYLCELAASLAPREENADEFLRLILNSISLLDKDKRKPLFVKAVFELRALAVSGYAPDLLCCDDCACFEAEEMYFSANAGRIRCGDCMKKHQGSGQGMIIPVTKGVLTAMRHIIYSEPQKLFSFTLSDTGYEQLYYICEVYLLAQMGESFKTLEFLKTLPR